MRLNDDEVRNYLPDSEDDPESIRWTWEYTQNYDYEPEDPPAFIKVCRLYAEQCRTNENNLEGWSQNVAGLQREIERLKQQLKEYERLVNTVTSSVPVDEAS